MKKFILFMTAAVLSMGSFTSFASDPAQKKDGFFDKVKKEVKKDFKKAKDGTVKAYDKTADVTAKAYDKTK
ncbi:MAG: hypothetical protein K2J42_05750, partial [Muribaculaceae bacterium]|nr:hypothetical protein [Muribaculaceae bacterium]